MRSTESYTMNFFLAFFLLAIPLFFHGVHASHEVFQELQSIDKAMPVNLLYRTKYHFQPLAHWINDPNGPMYYKGLYHLFYQYNPYGSVWGNIVWAHSVSTDLINWLPMEPAIFPSKEFDINGCWSGSATILPDGKPIILYTGINTKNQQVQNLATPANDMDPFLRDWVKSPLNPVMFPTESNQINASSFRDPTTAWKGKDGLWRVLIGSKRDSTGMAILYKSSDFKKWVQAKSPIHFSNNTGMWECPDFYPVPLEGTLGLDTSEDGSSLKHVLKVSLDDKKYEYYTVGTYNQDKDQYVPDTTSPDNSMGLRYDYGKFYASKTFFDPEKNRRILWGWMNESDSVFDDQQKGWAGVQAVPRKVWLDSSKKQLVQWPIEEIESLRRSKVSMDNTKLQSGAVVEIKGVTGSQADVEVTFELKSGLDVAEEFNQDVTNQLNAQLLCSQKDASNKGSIGPFGLFVLASKDLHEQTAVFFRVFKGQGDKPVVVMCSDQSKSSMGTELDKTTYGAFIDADLKDGKLSLRTLVDHSIVESFGAGGKTCITARVYPRIALGKDAHLFAFNYGSTAVSISNLSAWSVLDASIV